MTSHPTSIHGVKLFKLTRHHDTRGAFCEAFRASWLRPDQRWSQWNISQSNTGVLRGLHFHLRQSDYWTVTAGRILVALVDLRPDSPAYLKSDCLEMGVESAESLIIPPGVLHGYRALTDATVMYLVDHEYDGSDEYGVHWADPALALPPKWYDGPTPVLSPRDASAPGLAEVLKNHKII